MSDHDFDTGGPGEEELRDMLRSLPRHEAPGDFEPELMRRIASVRRRHGLLGVLHTAARTEWVGGLLSAAVAAVVVAGTWSVVFAGDSAPATRSAIAPQSIVRVAPSAAPHIVHIQSAVETESAPTPGPAKRATVAPRSRESRRSSAAAIPARRQSAASASRRADHVTDTPVRTLDTIVATRVRSRSAARTIPAPTEAGSRTAHPESGAPAPAPTSRGDGSSTEVDTGVR
jgi:hypothetical protein